MKRHNPNGPKHRLPKEGEYYIVTTFGAQYVARLVEVYPHTGAWIGERQHPRTSQHDSFVGSGVEVSGTFDKLTELVYA